MPREDRHPGCQPAKQGLAFSRLNTPYQSPSVRILVGAVKRDVRKVPALLNCYNNPVDLVCRASRIGTVDGAISCNRDASSLSGVEILEARLTYGFRNPLTVAGKPQSRNDVTRKLSGTARRYPLLALSSITL